MKDRELGKVVDDYIYIYIYIYVQCVDERGYCNKIIPYVLSVDVGVSNVNEIRGNKRLAEVCGGDKLHVGFTWPGKAAPTGDPYLLQSF